MKTEVTKAIAALEKQFSPSPVSVSPDNEGGARVIIDDAEIGPKFVPSRTWIGFHIPAMYPYADIYPVFIGGDVKRADGRNFEAPVTPGQAFENRQAIQVSRRTASASDGRQSAVAKILKVIRFLEEL